MAQRLLPLLILLLLLAPGCLSDEAPPADRPGGTTPATAASRSTPATPTGAAPAGPPATPSLTRTAANETLTPAPASARPKLTLALDPAEPAPGQRVRITATLRNGDEPIQWSSAECPGRLLLRLRDHGTRLDTGPRDCPSATSTLAPGAVVTETAWFTGESSQGGFVMMLGPGNYTVETEVSWMRQEGSALSFMGPLRANATFAWRP